MTDRSERVIPLAQRIMDVLKTETDSAVQIAAFDVAKLGVDVLRFDARRKDITGIKRKVLDVISSSATEPESIGSAGIVA